MYHRFDEDQYPSTNINMNIFKKHIEKIKNKKINFINPSKFEKDFTLKRSSDSNLNWRRFEYPETQEFG